MIVKGDQSFGSLFLPSRLEKGGGRIMAVGCLRKKITVYIYQSIHVIIFICFYRIEVKVISKVKLSYQK
jgi:hypothetical protein